jgi:hypothetical protein
MKVIHVGCELQAAQRPVDQFLAREWQGLRESAISKPRFSRKQL